MVQKRVYEEEWLRDELKRLELVIIQRRKLYIDKIKKAERCWGSLIKLEDEERIKRKWLDECLSKKEVVKEAK